MTTLSLDELLGEVDGAVDESVGPHTLHILGSCSSDLGDSTDWELEHGTVCVARQTGDHDYYCPYQYEADNMGSDAFDVDIDTLPAGIYPVVWWHRTEHHWEYGPEYYSGLAVAVKQ